MSFYDERYLGDYMEGWEQSKKDRVSGMISCLGLSDKARVLDLGCGRAECTLAIKRAHPAWEIHGFDISSIAIEKNRSRYPEVEFHTPESLPTGTFDLIYSHHVLEHVEDLDTTLAWTASLVRPGGLALHILPCGNPGSFEHWITRLVRNGVEPSTGRFHFEEPSHMRRLRSDQLTQLCRRHRFELRSASFACHFWGAVRWITESNPALVVKLLDPRRGTDTLARAKLGVLLALLLPVAMARIPSRSEKALQKLAGRISVGGIHWRAAKMLLSAGRPVAEWLETNLDHRTEEEWQRRKSDPGGSEMYLLFERQV